MAYIRKNVNLFLLLLIIIILGSLAGITTYYQSTYKNLSESYSEKLDQLSELNYNLSLQAAQLMAVSDELRLKTEVKQKFDSLYSNITDYNEKISADLDQANKELVSTIAKLKDTHAELQTAKSELDNTKAALKTQLKYSSEQSAEISSLRSQICALRQRLNESC